MEHTEAVPGSPAGAGETRQFLTFALGDEEFGIDILKVQEIKGYSAITRVPRTPQDIRGVMNLRGTIVPIVDLRTKFQLEPREYDRFTVIIVVVVRGRAVGLVVDAVSDVTIGQNVVFGPGVTVADRVEILPFCHIEGATVAEGARIGPFARLRPGSEIGEDVLKLCRPIVVDSVETALKEAGDLLPLLEKGRLSERRMVELGDVIIGRHPGRTSPEQITIFESQGMAIQDIAVAVRLEAMAREQGLGVELPYGG